MSVTHRAQAGAPAAAHRTQTQAAPAEAPRQQAGFVLGGLIAALILGGMIFSRSGQVPLILFGLGLALGFVLFHSRFGFTSAWRQLVAVRQGRALRAHML